MQPEPIYCAPPVWGPARTNSAAAFNNFDCNQWKQNVRRFCVPSGTFPAAVASLRAWVIILLVRSFNHYSAAGRVCGWTHPHGSFIQVNEKMSFYSRFFYIFSISISIFIFISRLSWLCTLLWSCLCFPPQEGMNSSTFICIIDHEFNAMFISW